MDHPLVERWKDRAPQHMGPVSANREALHLDDRGILTIAWPAGVPEGIDLILSTTNEPNGRPDPAAIARAWLVHEASESRREEYFFRNVEFGIRTPDDLEIWHEFEKSNPTFIKDRGWRATSATRERSRCCGMRHGRPVGGAAVQVASVCSQLTSDARKGAVRLPVGAHAPTPRRGLRAAASIPGNERSLSRDCHRTSARSAGVLIAWLYSSPRGVRTSRAPDGSIGLGVKAEGRQLGRAGRAQQRQIPAAGVIATAPAREPGTSANCHDARCCTSNGGDGT
jgi:hypothetical protein